MLKYKLMAGLIWLKRLCVMACVALIAVTIYAQIADMDKVDIVNSLLILVLVWITLSVFTMDYKGVPCNEFDVDALISLDERQNELQIDEVQKGVWQIEGEQKITLDMRLMLMRKRSIANLLSTLFAVNSYSANGSSLKLYFGKSPSKAGKLTLVFKNIGGEVFRKEIIRDGVVKKPFSVRFRLFHVRLIKYNPMRVLSSKHMSITQCYAFASKSKAVPEGVRFGEINPNNDEIFVNVPEGYAEFPIPAGVNGLEFTNGILKKLLDNFPEYTLINCTIDELTELYTYSEGEEVEFWYYRKVTDIVRRETAKDEDFQKFYSRSRKERKIYSLSEFVELQLAREIYDLRLYPKGCTDFENTLSNAIVRIIRDKNKVVVFGNGEEANKIRELLSE